MDKLSYETLEAMVTEARTQVVPGSKWRHYKGGEYTIRDIVVMEEGNGLAVVYTPLLHPEVSFVRPLAVWTETVEWNGQQVQRFSKFD